MNTSVLIADDHGVLRAGLRALLNSEPGLEVVGEAADGLQALRIASRLSPDVVLADISMPGRTGIEVARELRQSHPDIHVLILTMHEDPGLAQEALDAGAAGYVTKRAAEARLIDAIHAAAGHEIYVDRSLNLDEDQGPNATQPPADDISLSGQEAGFLKLLASAHTGQQIATVLGLTLDELDTLRDGLAQRLGAHGRVGLVREARRRGLI